MALADTAKLIVDLSLKGNFASQLASTQRSLTSFDRQITSTQGRAYKAGQQIGTGIKTGALLAAGAIGFLATQVGFGLRSLSELEAIVAQSNAVLKSTKGVAGQTADSVRNLAEQYESLNATIDDKVIQSGENLLLTFTNIRKDAFEPALKAALDMNAALGRGESGLQGTIQQLGVALNDPILGLTRLQRAGIVFTKSQKEQIKAAVEAGDTFKAQGIILAELNKRYGGSFLAGGQTTTGKIAKFKDAIEDLQKALATALLPTIGKVADKLGTFLRDPKVVKTISELGDSIASLFSDKNLEEGGKFLGTVFDTAKAAAPVLKDAAGTMLTVVKAAVSAFRSLPEGIQQLAIGAFAINKLTGGLVTNIGGAVAGGIADAVLRKFAGVVNVSGAVVNVAGAAGVPGAVGAATGSKTSLLPAIGIGSLIVAAAVPIGEAFAAALPDSLKGGPGPDTGKTQSQLGREFLQAQIAANQKLGSIGKDIDDVSLATALSAQRLQNVKDADQSTARSTKATSAAASKTAAAVAAAKEKIANEARKAAIASRQTTEAVKDKDLSVKVTTPPVTVNVFNTAADQIKTRATFKKAGNVYVS